MRIILWTVLVALVPTCLVGQNVRREARSHQCKETNKYTPEERLKIYPFRTATEIRLVSFSHRPDTSIVEYGLPVINGQVDLSKMTESVSLNKSKIDSLTDVLFNIGFRGKTLTAEVYSCYSPRNAILFIDDKGKAFEYIELCFECHNNRLSSRNIETGEFCSGKYEMIKDFFLRQGIKFVRGMGPE